MQWHNERSQLSLVLPPSVEPVTLAEARAHLRIEDVDSPAPDDALINALIVAARQSIDGADGWLGRAIVTQTWDWKPAGFRTRMLVPLPRLQSVTYIKYLDKDGAEQTVDPANYRVITGEAGMVVPAVGSAWPETLNEPASVTVRFVAGYAPEGSPPDDYTANVPQAIKQAMLLLIGHWYENREEVIVGTSAVKLPAAAESLLFPFRIWA